MSGEVLYGRDSAVRHDKAEFQYVREADGFRYYRYARCAKEGGTMDIRGFWRAVLDQEGDAMRGYFAPEAVVNWHCTNESFTIEEFIRANCDYPGRWDGEIERIERAGDLVITVTRVFPKEGAGSFHAVSFIRVEDGRIRAVDEYWADDGEAPQWRREMGIGGPIRPRSIE